MNLIELINNIAFGGNINEKLHQLMQDHIKKIEGNCFMSA